MLKRNLKNETKICPVCGRSFSNRRKWKDCFDNVIYCSDKCRKLKKQLNNNVKKNTIS